MWIFHHDKKRVTWVNWACERVFALSFLLLRLIFVPLLVYHVITQSYVSILLKILACAMQIFNIVFAIKIVKIIAASANGTGYAIF